MSNHVTEWLNAYVDGELPQGRLRQVQAHLAQCETCLAELEYLEKLSTLLQTVPEPAFLSAERFSSQVNLRLPHSAPVSTRTRAREIGWWLIPVGLLAAWIFITTLFFVEDIFSLANSAGILTSTSGWLRFVGVGATEWSDALGQFGILSGDTLGFATIFESFTRTVLPQLVLHLSIALLYLGWLAIWWARYRRQEIGHLLEG